MNYVEVVILSVIEGITEFLPISSTGHMIIAKEFLKIQDNPEIETFLIAVQLGAIFAVVSLFWNKLILWLKSWIDFVSRAPTTVTGHQARSECLSFMISTIPVVILGLWQKKLIKSLFSVHTVAMALIVGGVMILGQHYYTKNKVTKKESSDFNLKDGFILGLGQCLALWPGFSRSAATIMTGRMMGYSRTSAAEMSFLAGLPVLVGASAYEIIKALPLINAEWIAHLCVGILISWVVAFFCVKGFVTFLQKFSLVPFAIYRLAIGLILLAIY
jgi:undecaprenyl-diphosphatase